MDNSQADIGAYIKVTKTAGSPFLVVDRPQKSPVLFLLTICWRGNPTMNRAMHAGESPPKEVTQPEGLSAMLRAYWG